MIFVNRSVVPEPDILRRATGSLAGREFVKAHAYYRDFEKNRQRGHFQFTAYRHPSVKQALNELFKGKCAYCESPLTAVSSGDIELFRPKAGVVTGDGRHLPLHYWWLANSWSNLYLACTDCNRQRRHPGMSEASGKGGRFPIADESARAPVEAGPELIAREQPLLLDPCEFDFERSLIFDENGTVASSNLRGQTTIEVLGLNRPGLVEARRQRAEHLSQRVQFLLTLMEESTDERDIEEEQRIIQEMIEADAPYAGMCRQLLQGFSEGRDAAFFDRVFLRASAAPVSTRERRTAKADLAKFRKAQEDYSLEGLRKADLEKYRTRDRRIEGVTIRNVRAIKSLTLDVVDGGGASPWLMLLGENASGKSSVLQSLALALIGEKYFRLLRKRYGLDLAGMVGPADRPAEIEIRLTGSTQPRKLSIDRSGAVTFSGHGAQVLLLAYGSTRLLPRRNSRQRFGAGYARIENLFDPFMPLADAERWLMEAPGETFDYAAVALKKLLGIAPSRKFDRSLGYVALWEGGVPVPLRRLCDGYQTVIALFVDILDIVMPIWHTPGLAQGLVLIDEVGNHLHPSWKLRFVAGMREFLPRIQVIATTHEPLCLRGLRDGEIVVLRRRPRGGIFKVEDLPSIEGMRIDQLLTSEHFGLESTLDPALKRKFDEYHRLLRSRSESPGVAERIKALQSEVNEMQALGHTERERLLLGAIDRFLADREVTRSPAARTQLSEALDKELRTLWLKAEAPL